MPIAQTLSTTLTSEATEERDRDQYVGQGTGSEANEAITNSDKESVEHGNEEETWHGLLKLQTDPIPDQWDDLDSIRWESVHKNAEDDIQTTIEEQFEIMKIGRQQTTSQPQAHITTSMQ